MPLYLSHIQLHIGSMIQTCRWDVSVSPLARNFCMLVTLTLPIRPRFLHLCIGAAQLELTFRLGAVWHKQLSDSIIWELPCPDQRWAHTGPDKRHPWQLVGHVFFLSLIGPQSSVAASQSDKWGCVNGIKRDTVDLCICFGLRFCVMNGI